MSQADAWTQQGMKLQSVGQTAEAEALYRQALAAEPTHKMALYMLGNSLNARGDFAQGVALLEQAVAAQPTFVEAHYSLGVAFSAQQRYEESIQAFERAIAVHPDFREAHSALGNLYLSREALPEAETAFQNVLRLKPDDLDALWHLNLICQKTQRAEEAMLRLRRIVQLQPNNLKALPQLAMLAMQAGLYEEAAACYERCLRRSRDNWELANALGAIYCNLERFEEAESYAHAAVALKPDQREHHYNLGIAQYKQGKMSEACASFAKAHEIDPADDMSLYSLWTALLLNGDLAQGWELHEEWMQRGLLNPRAFEQSAWEGDAHPDGTLLVYANHGYGDAFQFARYLPLVKQRFQGRVVLECPSELHRLLQSCAGIDSLVARDPDRKPPALPFDRRIGLESLTHLFGTTLETIPADIPYLRASEELCAQWRERLADSEAAFTVGIRWTGNPTNQWNEARSCRLKDFAPLAKIPGVRFVNLQVGYGADEVRRPPEGMRLLDLAAEIGDFADTAAILQNLDLVITIETSVAHLAGALGVPTWTLLAFIPDWRWLMNREDSPWYPTMRLFRQTRHGGWPETFERMAQALQAQVEAKG